MPNRRLCSSSADSGQKLGGRQLARSVVGQPRELDRPRSGEDLEATSRTAAACEPLSRDAAARGDRHRSASRRSTTGVPLRALGCRRCGAPMVQNGAADVCGPVGHRRRRAVSDGTRDLFTMTRRPMSERRCLVVRWLTKLGWRRLGGRTAGRDQWDTNHEQWARSAWDRLTPEERLVCLGKRLGFSSRALARSLGQSSVAIRAIVRRARAKIAFRS